MTSAGPSPGKVTVKVELEGLEPVEMAVIAREGQQTPVKFTLISAQTCGSLRVQSAPAGAYAGTTPDSMRKVAEGPHRVTVKDANGLGIYDMSGNVWERFEDGYDESAYSSHSGIRRHTWTAKQAVVLTQAPQELPVPQAVVGAGLLL